MRAGTLAFPAIERIVYGRPAALALSDEVERLGVERVFLLVSGTMNRTTDEVDKVRAELGSRYAASFDGMPPHTQRLWQSWHDYMGEWCQRQDFREALPALLEGEDTGFRQYIQTLLEDAPRS